MAERDAQKDLDYLDELIECEDDGGDLGEFACNHMGYWIQRAMNAEKQCQDAEARYDKTEKQLEESEKRCEEAMAILDLVDDYLCDISSERIDLIKIREKMAEFDPEEYGPYIEEAEEL